jgi:hypothetical protein
MSDRFELVLDAHGGLDRRHVVTEPDIRVSLTGQVYEIKGQPQGMSDRSMRIDSRELAVVATLPFGGRGRMRFSRPERTRIADGMGKVVDERTDSRTSFAGHVLGSQWTALQLLCFNS